MLVHSLPLLILSLLLLTTPSLSIPTSSQPPAQAPTPLPPPLLLSSGDILHPPLSPDEVARNLHRLLNPTPLERAQNRIKWAAIKLDLYYQTIPLKRATAEDITQTALAANARLNLATPAAGAELERRPTGGSAAEIIQAYDHFMDSSAEHWVFVRELMDRIADSEESEDVAVVDGRADWVKGMVDRAVRFEADDSAALEWLSGKCAPPFVYQRPDGDGENDGGGGSSRASAAGSQGGAT